MSLDDYEVLALCTWLIFYKDEMRRWYDELQHTSDLKGNIFMFTLSRYITDVFCKLFLCIYGLFVQMFTRLMLYREEDVKTTLEPGRVN